MYGYVNYREYVWYYATVFDKHRFICKLQWAYVFVSIITRIRFLTSLWVPYWHCCVYKCRLGLYTVHTNTYDFISWFYKRLRH